MAIPLSHHRTHAEWVFTSGQMGRDGDGIVPPDFGAQMRVAIESLRTNLEAAGASRDTVVKTTVFLTRREDFAEMNDIYAKYFSQPWPARSTVAPTTAQSDKPDPPHGTQAFADDVIAVLDHLDVDHADLYRNARSYPAVPPFIDCLPPGVGLAAIQILEDAGLEVIYRTGRCAAVSP